MSRSRRRGCLFLFALLLGCRAGEVREPTAPPPPPRPTPTPPATPVPGLPTSEPTVRVGIAVDTNVVAVTANTAFELYSGERVLASSAAGETWTVTPAGDGGLQARNAAGAAIAAGPGPWRVVTRGEGLIRIEGRPYRGEALLLARPGGRITAANVVAIEDYLLGVVPREIGRRPVAEMDAMKAQAVAARTYAIGNLGGRNTRGFDFFATVLDQVYGGVMDEDSLVSRAVRETRGEIVTFEGRPILAYYSSTCGGQTAAIEESWPWREPLRYLRSVSDRIPGTDSAYCATSSRYSWSATWTRPQLLEVLGQTLRTFAAGAPPVRRVEDAQLVGVNGSERATVRIAVDGRAYTLRADSIRWVLRPPPGTAILNSSKLRRVDARSTDGEMASLTIDGGGWGHGIGMCQVGAMGRARAGQSYHQILRTYYTGTEIRRLY